MSFCILKINKCGFIKIHCEFPTDNNHLYYENKPLFERFKGPYINSNNIKTIVKEIFRN